MTDTTNELQEQLDEQNRDACLEALRAVGFSFDTATGMAKSDCLGRVRAIEGVDVLELLGDEAGDCEPTALDAPCSLTVYRWEADDPSELILVIDTVYATVREFLRAEGTVRGC